MAGHSKWHNIKHKKAKEDAMRGKIFTRMIKEITIIARDGGGDVAANAKLRLAVEKAKAANMPKDNIDRAIKKGTGELEGVDYESILYEGTGPRGLAIMLAVLTDNRNRTVASLRHYFNKHNGRLAENGAVAWMFEHKGAVEFDPAGKTEDEIFEKFLDADIEDVHVGNGLASITCDMKSIDSVRTLAESLDFKVQAAEPRWMPKECLSFEKESDEEQVYKFLEGLEELEDVQNIYANVA